MEGNSLQTESNFVGAAVVTGSKVIKGISKAKKAYDSKQQTKPLPTAPKPTPQNNSGFLFVAIAATVILIIVLKK